MFNNIYVRFLNVHLHIASGWHSRFQLLYPFIFYDQPVVLTLTSRTRNHHNLQIAYSIVHKMSHYRLFSLMFYVSHMFATGAACQQRTLTPLDTWSCLTLGLASVLMLRPISPKLVLFPDF